MTARASFLTELSVASRKLRTLFDAAVRARGLTLSRARLLLHLARNPDLTQSELAGLMELEPPTLVRLLDGLEKQGLIRRCAVAGDRRAKHIALTEKAQPQVAALEELSASLEALLLAEIPPEAVATTRSVLTRFTQAIEAQSPATLLDITLRQRGP